MHAFSDEKEGTAYERCRHWKPRVAWMPGLDTRTDGHRLVWDGLKRSPAQNPDLPLAKAFVGELQGVVRHVKRELGDTTGNVPGSTRVQKGPANRGPASLLVWTGCSNRGTPRLTTVPEWQGG